QRGEYSRVSNRSRISCSFDASFDFVYGVKADQAFGAIQFFHNRVAGIDASRAAYTFHLQALPDINAGRTYLDTEVAVYAIADGLRGCFFPMAARLTPAMIISNGDTLVVQ